jgi:hypothetical protein
MFYAFGIVLYEMEVRILNYGCHIAGFISAIPEHQGLCNTTKITAHSLSALY